MENPQLSVEIRTPLVKDKAPTEMRGRSDGYRVPGDSSSGPTLAYSRDGLSKLGRVRYLRLPNPPQRIAQPGQYQRPVRAPTPTSSAPERRRLERDLHDGVQSELVVLIVKLALAKQDPRTPPTLAGVLAGLEARAQAVLDSVRDIARGIYPPLLTAFGVTEALRAQAARAAIQVSIVGSAPRGSEEAEEAVYFCCSEAIQNAAKHAGPTQVKLWLHHHHGTLVVRIADDGRGFDPARTSGGVGLRNIRERVEDVDGVFEVASRPGHGTVLTISLPWPAAAGGQR